MDASMVHSAEYVRDIIDALRNNEPVSPEELQRAWDEITYVYDNLRDAGN